MPEQTSPRIQGGFAASVPAGRRLAGSFDREVIGHLKELVVPYSPTVLIGASTGILTGQLHRAKVDVLALEPSEIHLEHLRRSLPRVPAVLAEAILLPLQTSGSGSVVAEAGELRASMVDELRRVLRPEGVLICVDRDRDGGEVALDAGVYPGRPGAPGHVENKVLVSGGFELVERTAFGDTTVTVWR